MGHHRKWMSIALIALVLPACKYYEVDTAKVFRSAQPSADNIKEAANAGIKTVINLRGPNPGHTWYDAEKEATTKAGILQIDIPMSADRLPHRRDLIKLLDAFKTVPRPMLIHCMAGVDRTGEASAIYQMLYMGKSREEALKMLSSEFMHYEVNKPAKIYFIRDVWQGEEWARNEYDPCSGKYKHYDTSHSECSP